MAKKQPKKGAAKRAAKKAKVTRTTAETHGAESASDRALLAAADKAEVSGQTWKPQVPGDSIVGEVLSLKKDAKTKFGAATILILGVSGGATRVFCNKSLEDAIEEHGVKLGDRIAVQFKDSINTGKGRPFRLFVIVKQGKGKGKGKSPRK